MNPRNFQEAIWLRNRTQEVIAYNNAYREKHPEFEQFELSDDFWYKIYTDLQLVHWAVIKKYKYSKVIVYFINVDGRAFDRIILENEKDAKKLLQKSNFVLNKKIRAPYIPVQPIFISIIKSKKKALYSKAGWLNYKAEKKNKEKKLVNFLIIFLLFLLCFLALKSL